MEVSKIKIVIVNGTMRAGKTTFETMVKEIAASQGHSVKILSTIDYVKEIAKMIGWDGKKDKESRRFLSDLKDTLTRWKDLPYQEIKKEIEYQEINKTDLIFIDCREPEEIQRFVDDYQALTLIVQRGEDYIPIGNHADDNVTNYQYDIVINNNRGLDELMQEATIFEEIFVNSEGNI